MREILKRSTEFLFCSFITLLIILILFCEFGCTSASVNTGIELHFKMIDQGAGQPVLLCLTEEDMDKIKEKLIRCSAQ